METEPQVIPCDCEGSIRKLWDDVWHVRFDIFYKQRLINLLPLRDLSVLPACLPFDKSAFYREISVQPNQIFDSISPKQVQFISQFYSFLLNNLEALCSIANNAKKLLEEPSLKFFATSAVSSVFGYFSCYEHLVLAFRFYSIMVTKSPKGVLFEFLKPFFCNACTYHYIEAVTIDLAGFFCSDTRLTSGDKVFHILREHEPAFIRSVLSHLNLLPRPHLLLLSLMKRAKIETESIFKFFLESFVFPQMVARLKCSAFVSFVELFEKLRDFLLEEFSRFNFEDLFCASESIIEIPTAFSDFSETKIQLIVTPLDAEILMSMAVNCVTLPENVQKCACEEFLMHQPYLPLIVRVSLSTPVKTLYTYEGDRLFFNSSVKPQEPFKNQSFMKRYRELEKWAKENGVALSDVLDEKVPHPLFPMFKDEMDYDQSCLCKDCYLKLVQNHDAQVCERCKRILDQKPKISFTEYATRLMRFDGAEKQATFETFLQRKCALNQLLAWSRTVDSQFDGAVLSTVTNILSDFFEEKAPAQAVKLSDPKVITSIAPIFESNHVKRLYHAVWAGKLYKSILSSKHKDIRELEQGWWQCVVKCFAEMTVPETLTSENLSKSKKNLLEKKVGIASTLLSNISNIEFERRYQRLIQGLTLIKRVSDFLGVDAVELLKFTINNAHNPRLITTVLLISAMFMKNVRFVGLCGQEETFLWYQFENTVLSVLDTHRNLGDLYTKVHDQIVVSLIQTHQ